MNSQTTIPNKSFCLRTSLSALALLWATAAQAQTSFNWIGPSGGQFSSPLNWTPFGGPPGAADSAVWSLPQLINVSFQASPINSSFTIEGGGAVTFRPTPLFPDTQSIYTLTDGFVIDSSALTVTGLGDSTFQLDVDSRLFVGASSGGTLNVLPGASVSSTGVSIGGSAGGIGIVNIDGTGAAWVDADSVNIDVGGNGTGTLNVLNGGTFTQTGAGITRLGANAGATGMAMIDGPGSTWTNSQNFNVGLSGTGFLSITNGGRMTNLSTVLGFLAGSSGTVVVDGTDSTLEDVGFGVFVGRDGDGTMTVSGGGTVTSLNGFLGANPGSSGTVTVDGAGSNWTNSDNLFVGEDSEGTLIVSGGGRVSNVDGFIGPNLGSSGTVTVNGADSLWDVGGDLTVGGDGVALLTLTDHQGEVAVDGQIFVNPFSQIRLFGGKLTTPTLSNDALAALNWQGGTLNLTDPAGLTIGTGGLLGDSVGGPNKSLGTGGPLVIETGSSLVVGPTLAAASIAVQPGSDFALVGTTVNGPVKSPAGSAMNIIGDVTFNDQVSGAGNFFGSGTATFNGGHSPGDSPAIVSVEGNLVYGPANELLIELGGTLTGQFDRLEILGDATLDGLLTLDILPGFTPSFGDVFEIFDVAGALSGQFLGLGEGALFAADTGQQFQISYLGGDGNNVVLTAVPEPTGALLALLGIAISGLGTRNTTRRSRMVSKR